MTSTSKSHWQVVAFAFIGLALVGTGLSLAVLSNPTRFSINVADDRYIQLFAISSFACTLIGIVVFLYAIRNTTKSMPAHLQTNANIGLGLGFVLQLAGFFLSEIIPNSIEISLALFLAGLAGFVWGGMHFAQGNGYPKSLGLMAIFGILGVIVLILLPYRGSKLVTNEST